MDGVMVCMFALIAVDREFEPLLGQTKDYKIDICWFLTKHAALWRKSKDGLARNQDNVSEWGQHGYPLTVVSVSSHYKNPTKCVGLVQTITHSLFYLSFI
jgi:hypothetical protein